MIPSDSRIARVMEDTGMDRLPAIRHLQSRDILVKREQERRRLAGGGR